MDGEIYNFPWLEIVHNVLVKRRCMCALALDAFFAHAKNVTKCNVPKAEDAPQLARSARSDLTFVGRSFNITTLAYLHKQYLILHNKVILKSTYNCP